MTSSTTVEFSEFLIEGAKEVFETMIFMSIEKSADATAPLGDNILGTITFTGDVQGCVGICCSKNCATSIAANMMGLDDPSALSQEEIADAVGEVANMVMGSFKARLLPTYNTIDVSIPSVVSGVNLDTMLVDGQNRAVVPVMIDEHQARLMLLTKAKS
ncbi:MAG: hypothetical protein A2Y12_18520 [Planctomycetes bacterium GWF2_42_9]|nr:MAG: hypothetical protein A2Y12_18520 [Planctomycetes bacterium GWF2_42_9]